MYVVIIVYRVKVLVILPEGAYLTALCVFASRFLMVSASFLRWPESHYTVDSSFQSLAPCQITLS